MFTPFFALLALGASPLATVNKEPLVEAHLAAELQRRRSEQLQADGEAACRAAVEAAIDRKLLVQEARRLGLAEQPAVAGPVKEFEQQTAGQQLYQLEVAEKAQPPAAELAALPDEAARAALLKARTDARREAFHRELWSKYAVKEPKFDWTLDGLQAALQQRSTTEVATWTGGRLTLGAFAERLDLAQVATLPPDYKERLESLRHELVRREVVKLEVAARGLLRAKPVADAVDAFRSDRLLALYLSAHLLKGLSVTPAEVRAWYDAHPADYTVPERRRLLQIVVPTEKKALATLRKLQVGAKFESLARTLSEDAESAARDGELGWVDTAQLIPELRPVLELEVGEVSQPLPTARGLRLVKVAEIVPATVAPFQDVRGQIEVALLHAKREERTQARLKALRARAAISVDPKAVTQACAAPGAAPR